MHISKTDTRKDKIRLKFFCVDIGSTYVKIVLYDSESGNIESHRTSSPEREGIGGRFEIGAELFLDIIQRELAAALNEDFEPDSLIISTQMHGFVLEDIYVSWQDTSCLEIEEGSGITYLECLREILPDDVMKNTGTVIKPSLGLCNLYTRSRTGKEWNDTAEIFTLGSWLIYKLTGRNVCHLSNAAPLGFADIGTGEWNRDILQRTGLDGLILPEIAKEDFSPVGSFTMRGRTINVYPDYGDQQVAVFGAAGDNNEVILNVATAAQVIRISDVQHDAGCENRPFFGGRYLNVITNLPSGRNLKVLIRFIQASAELVTGNLPDETEIWQRLHDGSPSENITVDPRFFCDQGSADGGSISGINSDNLSPDTVISASIDAMAAAYRDAILRISDNERIKRVICIGGVCRKNPSLVTRLESQLAVPCVVYGGGDEAIEGFVKIARECEANNVS